MSRIKILDCTLRDGGYINNWKFGEAAIRDILSKNISAGVDIIEAGYLRDEPDDINSTVYSSPAELNRIIKEKNPDIMYAVMIEMACYFPYEMITPRNENSFDLIRYTFWKRCLDEAFEYCKRIKEKGYELGVQPTRVEQYSEKDFADMIARFSELEPYAIYIVDTFGLLTKDMLKKYADIAERYLPRHIALGYHAHNNMQQAMDNAVALTELGLDRDIILDASVMGMGRGAGNLNSETFLSYLNLNHGKNYDIASIYEIWDKWLRDTYDKKKWGYNMHYLVSASHKGNPNFADYFIENEISVAEADRIMRSIPYEERIIFSREKIKKYMEM